MVNYQKYQTILKILISYFQKEFGQNFLSCALFGSVARGTAEKESDIDLIVVYREGKFDPFDKFISFLKKFRKEKEYQKLKDEGFWPDPYPIFLTKKRLKENPWILLDVIEEGIILFDREDILKKQLNEFRARLKNLGAKKVSLPDGTWYWDLKPDWKPGEIIKI